MVSVIIFPYIDILFIMRYKIYNKNMRQRRRGHIEGKASGKKQKCNRRKDAAEKQLEEEVKEK